MTEILDLNFDWYFKEQCEFDSANYAFFDDFKKVQIPHNVKDIPLNYFDEKMYQFKSLYRRTIRVLPSMQKKEKYLVFEGVAHIAKVYVNEELVYTHVGGYSKFEVDLTNYLTKLTDYIITVEVDSNEHEGCAPFGGVVDYLCFGGIYREVYLKLQDKAKLVSTYIKTNNTIDTNIIEFDIETKNISELEIEIEGKKVEYNVDKEIDTYSFDIKDLNLQLWDIENPKLYDCKIRCYNGYDLKEDLEYTFGIRKAVFTKDGFYLNNKKIKLHGLNRHQSYPYCGYAASKEAQYDDAKILKDLGVNIVRCSHYMQSKHFLDMCDKLGILVFEEIPGWQHIGEKAFMQNSYQNVKDMILTDRNHPSIILWGVRINESADSSEFYKNTNMLAHRYDSERQTGGVRNFVKSELLEDVYTYNDFSHEGKNVILLDKKKVCDIDKPYLVTECNGHMFPTKSYDNESRRLEHALRHMRIYDKANELDGLSGAISWCMSDYNTHKDFGSGDMICYHGVLDIYRNPKLASYAYKSQKEDEYVLEVSSSLNIGEYDAGQIGDVYIFTNLDKVRVSLLNNQSKTFICELDKSTSPFKNLKHPPFVLSDFVGDRLMLEEGFSKKYSDIAKKLFKAVSKHGTNVDIVNKIRMVRLMTKYHLNLDKATSLYFKYASLWGKENTKVVFEGIKDGVVVKTVVKEEVKQTKYNFNLTSDKLVVDKTYSQTKLTITKTDQNGNILPYSFDSFKVECTDGLEIVGPSSVSLVAGQLSIWFRTTKNYREEKYLNNPLNYKSTIKVYDYENNVYEFEVDVILNKESK